MRVMIIAAPYPLEECPAAPLGVSYVASAFLSTGADVQVADYIVNRYTPEKLAKAIADFQPDIIGANCVTLNFPGAADIVRTAKRLAPHAITMMGGCHVSFDMAGTLNEYPEVDIICVGEGEKTIAELMAAFTTGGDWTQTKGIAFKKNGELVFTGHQDFIEDLDALPLPARHLLPMSRYRALGFPISIITGRGCPYNCIFCVGRSMVGKKHRHRRADLVVDEIEDMMSYGWDRINIVDDLFTANKEKVLAVCDEMHRRKLKLTWTAFCRVNSVDLEVLKAMQAAGCDMISFGMETGNAEMLKRIRKGATLEQARRAAALCKEAGIAAHASFVAGLPGETWETIRETDEFSSSLGIIYGYHILAPFPGTTVREEVEKYDLEILTSDWTKYDANQAVARTAALSKEDIEKFVGEFNAEMDKAWDKMVEHYHAGVANTEETLRVAGHYRMELVYKMLSEDLVERYCTFTAAEAAGSANGGVDLLCRRLESLTGSARDVVEFAITHYCKSGFLKAEPVNGGGLAWYWTHNNRTDRTPCAGAR
jgi:anaerobic magnesium-protoporphyrin IX monomethyl ester cyclase